MCEGGGVGGGGHSLYKCGRDAPIKRVLFLESVCVLSLKSWTWIQIYLFGKSSCPRGRGTLSLSSYVGFDPASTVPPPSQNKSGISGTPQKYLKL